MATDLFFAADNAVGNLRAATNAAIALTQYGRSPASAAQLTSAINAISTATATLTTAMAALTTSPTGVELNARTAQSQALAAAIQSALALATSASLQLKKVRAAGL